MDALVGGVMWTGHRAQISSATTLLSRATVRVENGLLPVTVRKEAGGDLWRRGAGKPLGKEQRDTIHTLV